MKALSLIFVGSLLLMSGCSKESKPVVTVAPATNASTPTEVAPTTTPEDTKPVTPSDTKQEEPTTKVAVVAKKPVKKCHKVGIRSAVYDYEVVGTVCSKAEWFKFKPQANAFIAYHDNNIADKNIANDIRNQGQR